MPLLIIVFFSQASLAENIKLVNDFKISGSEETKIKLIDLVIAHKLDQKLVPVFEGIELFTVKKNETKKITRQELAISLRELTSQHAQLKNVKFILPSTLNVIHFGTEVKMSALAQMLRRKWSSQCSSCKFAIENINIPEVERKYEGHHWYLKTSESLPRGRFSAQLIFPKVEKPATLWVTGQAMSKKPVAVVSRNVSHGEAIDLSWVVLAFRNIGEVNDAITDLEILNKKVSAKYLMAGDIIKTKYLTSKVMFNRGDAVKLVYRNDHLNLSTSAIAEGSGKVGERVWVKSMSSQKRVSGKVLLTGEVLVQ